MEVSPKPSITNKKTLATGHAVYNTPIACIQISVVF